MRDQHFVARSNIQSFKSCALFRLTSYFLREAIITAWLTAHIVDVYDC